MRCARCGNENSEGNRFCGMCGAGLLVKGQAPSAAMPAPVEKVEKKAEPAAVGSSAEARLPARSANLGTSTDSSPMSAGPMITGPSFLGLNKPADGGRDSLGRPSRNLDYLLEDDEEKPRRGWGKLLMVVIALALLGGLGYLRWKQGGFDWVTQNKKPAAATESQGAADSGTSGSSTGGASGPSSDASSGAPGTSAPSSTPSAGGTSAAPAPDAAAPSAAGQDAGTANAAAAGGAAAGPSTPAENVAPPKPAADSAGDKAADADAGDATGAAAAAPPESTTAPPKKMRKPTPVTPVDATAEAERYIYGRGVPQDCDRGLHMLKPAAESNPKAMIALGTLYSTGTCTPRDLPTAYRWFAMALHKQPDNQPLQNDLQKLWGQMTQPERQLAIKLSQ